MTTDPPAMNVLGLPLEPCSHDPLTGFRRDGCCRGDPADAGMHVICAEMSSEFLQFSLHHGNDLVSPNAALGFPGLQPGDRWCVCARRWKEAYIAGVAPPVLLQSTHVTALGVVTLDQLRDCASDPVV
jgi:uncharacterized protein